MNIEARQAFLDQEDEGWAGTFLIEPLTALAGGAVGGLTVAAIAWRMVWRRASKAMH